MTSAAALEALEVEALVTDRYLEALLAAAERRADDAPADAALDPGVRRAARVLRDELVRVHPSFRFEERLARRLAEAAAGLRLAAAAGGDATVLPFAASLPGDPADGLLGDPADGPFGDPADPAAAAGPSRPGIRPAIPARAAVPRQVVVGGAVTSAALSLAGAAFVAWRLTRGAPADPMARAVRLARAARAGRAGRQALPRGLS